MPLKLGTYLDKECTREVHGDTIDYGEWEVLRGVELTFYIRNESEGTSAYFERAKHSDPRSNLILPERILPNEVAEAKIRIPAVEPVDNEDLEKYLEDKFDQINSDVKWRR